PADSDHLGRALMGLVTTDLAESGGLRIVSTARVLEALKDSGTDPARGFAASAAPEAARRAGAGPRRVGQATQAAGVLALSAGAPAGVGEAGGRLGRGCLPPARRDRVRRAPQDGCDPAPGGKGLRSGPGPHDVA